MYTSIKLSSIAAVIVLICWMHWSLYIVDEHCDKHCKPCIICLFFLQMFTRASLRSLYYFFQLVLKEMNNCFIDNKIHNPAKVAFYLQVSGNSSKMHMYDNRCILVANNIFRQWYLPGYCPAEPEWEFPARPEWSDWGTPGSGSCFHYGQ